MELFSRSEKKGYTLGPQDYTFNAIIKQGSLVASPSRAYVEAIDFSSKEFMFQLSPMQASVLMESWPDFETGLCGTWRLSFNEKSKLPSLSFLRAYNGRSAPEVTAFLRDAESFILFRDAYGMMQ